MTRTRRITVYIVLPVVAGALLLGLYFSRVPALQRVVSPKLPPLPENTWREYGLLENLQNGLLVAIVLVAAGGAVRARSRHRRVVLAVAAFLALGVLLEETDYGTHAVRLARAGDVEFLAPEASWTPADRQASWRHEWFNLHTSGKRFQPLKRLANAGVILFFVLVPLAFWLARRPAPAILPSLWLTATTVIGGGLRKTAHLLAWQEAAALERARAAGAPLWELGSLGSNLSEFGELFLYYCALLYVLEQLPGRQPGVGPPAGRE